MRAWGHSVVGFIVRHFPRRRQKEVHQRAGLDVAQIVVGNFLTQCDSQCFCQTAMHLPFNDHRIDPRTAVVQRIEAADFRDTRIDVNVHHADIGAERISHVGRIIVADRFKTRLHTRNGLIIGGVGDFLHRLEPLGRAFDDKAVDVPLNIIIVHFKQVSRDHLRLCSNFASGHRGCRPGHRCRTRSIGPQAVRRGIGVAFLDRDAIGGQADLAGKDLRKGRGVALPLRNRSKTRNC